MRVCNIGDTLNINHLRVRITKCLNLDRCGILLDRCLNSFIIKRIYEGSLNAVIRKCMCQKVVCTTINILSCYDVISLMSNCLECISECCCTTSYCQSCHTTLECCDSLLERILCRICQSSVNVTGISQTETICCMLAVVKYIRRCQINWYCSCIGYRVCLFLTYMKLLCLKF